MANSNLGSAATDVYNHRNLWGSQLKQVCTTVAAIGLQSRMLWRVPGVVASKTSAFLDRCNARRNANNYVDVTIVVCAHEPPHEVNSGITSVTSKSVRRRL